MKMFVVYVHLFWFYNDRYSWLNSLSTMHDTTLPNTDRKKSNKFKQNRQSTKQTNDCTDDK